MASYSLRSQDRRTRSKYPYTLPTTDQNAPQRSSHMDVRTSAAQHAAESPVSALSSLDTAAVHQTPVPASSSTDTAAAHQPVEAAPEGLHAPSLHNTINQAANKRCRVQNSPGNIDNEDPTPWVMVHPRRSRSLDVSTGRHSSMSNECHPYDPTIEAAREQLTPEQRAHLNKREAIVSSNPCQPSLQHEGQMLPKGKGVDPRNWGNIDIDPTEIDPAAQMKRLEWFKANKQARMNPTPQEPYMEPSSRKGKVNRDPKKQRERPIKERKSQKAPCAVPNFVEERDSLTKTDERGQRLRQKVRDELRPTAQIRAKSFLGKAFKEIHRRSQKPRNKSETTTSSSSSSDSNSTSSEDNSPDEDKEPPSDPDSASSSSSDSRSSDSSSSDMHRKKRNKSHRRRRKQRKRRKMLIQPRPPNEYNGEADYRTFHRFVKEAQAFVDDGQVRSKRQVSVISYYLKGKAHSFYTQKVAQDEHKWRLDKFFTEMFDYCFPLDFKQRLRAKLKRCYQGNRSVDEFMHELEELHAMIGVASKRERILNLWNGFNKSIQEVLWLQGLNPEISSWNKIVSAAQRIEISRNVVESHKNLRTSQPGNSGSNPKGESGNNGGQSRNGGRQGPLHHRGKMNRDNRNPKERTGSTAPDNRSSSKIPSNRNAAKPIKTQLSEKERNELIAAGKCFRCKEIGHMSWQCPQGNFVQSGKPGKAPGLPSHGISINEDDLHEVEHLRELAETTEELPMLSLNMITSDEIKIFLADCPESESELLGEVVTDFARKQLHIGQPYPGDEMESRIFDQYRFTFAPVPGSRDLLQIQDAARDPIWDDFQIKIRRRELLDPVFNIPLWYAAQLALNLGIPSDAVSWLNWIDAYHMGDPYANGLTLRLQECAHIFPEPINPLSSPLDRFLVKELHDDAHIIIDYGEGLVTRINRRNIQSPKLNIARWYCKCVIQWRKIREVLCEGKPLDPILPNEDYYFASLEDIRPEEEEGVLELFGAQIPANQLPALERNAVVTRDATRVVPMPVVIVARINGQNVRALVDSGSLGDFISTTAADQLGVERIHLQKPLTLQLAVQGSRSKVNTGAKVRFQYQEIDEERYLDVANISSYDLILGTPWIFQHQVTIGLNPSRVMVGSKEAQPLRGNAVTKIASRAMEAYDEKLGDVRNQLVKYAEGICVEALNMDLPLPPLRAINHTIPLIDENKTYPWRPSRCPEPLREQWNVKRDAYIRTGRWKPTTAASTAPMLLLTKPGTTLLRSVNDLRLRNQNTRKMASPMPDMSAILRRAAAKKYRSALDMKEAFEQIRVVPEHVPRTAVTTPDGTMVSFVVQQGDCNAPATCQALMNHIFASYIGVWMDIYIDDVIIYSNTLEEHVKHVRTIIDILKREKFYLSKRKLQFLNKELKILGHIIDDSGIRMDPDKINNVLAWKIPTNRDLLRGFLGAVGYLADDLASIRIPMGVLTTLTGDNVPFRWSFTHQRAFDEVKQIVEKGRRHSRVPLKYEPGSEPIFMITDGCATGISGVISQGSTWQTAKVAAFYSAKLNSAQQNYAVHEIEMLAGIETMLRYRDILQGAKFQWITDHKGLTHLLRQRDLSGRQARWMEKISEFDFEVIYIPGSENVLADALSRIYSNDAPGTVRAASEYTSHDITSVQFGTHKISIPLLAGAEAVAATPQRKTVPPAETGRPETSSEFAKRVKHHFVLRGPRERKEGGSAGNNTKKHNRSMNNDPSENDKTLSDSESPQSLTELTEESPPTATESPNNLERSLPEKDVADPNEFENPAPNTPLLSIAAGGREGIDLLKEVRNRYSEDPYFRRVSENPKEFKNFEITKDGYMYLNLDGQMRVCIPKIMVDGRNIREIVIAEAHSLLAHLGASKTIAYLRDQVWWKDLVNDTKAYCDSCQTCRRSKPTNQKPYGFLNPLPIPSRPWESIGIDFVGPLPESQNRDGTFTSVTTIIDLTTAMVHLVPSRIDYNAKEVAELLFEHVYKLHGVPKSIVSDRDVLFTSIFWEHLHKLIGTKLKMSSAYHPQTDGATERANRTITQMMRQCVGPRQRDWVSKLPAIEFAINSARSESTGYAPFFLNSGRMPRPMIWDHAEPNEYPGVRNFAVQRRIALMQAHDSVLAARVKQTHDANHRRRPCPFKEGDLCYLSTKNISFPKGLVRKLIPKYIGPYKIVQDFGNHSFKIDLPRHLKQRGVHDVFHASCLRIHIPNDDRLFPGRLDTQLGGLDAPDGEWAVEKVEGHVGSKDNAVFKIKWKSGDVTWMPYYQIEHLNALAQYFEALGIDNVSNLLPGTASNVPTDAQILLGTLSFLPIKNPTSLLTSHSFHPPVLSPMSNTALTHLYLSRIADHFVLVDPDNKENILRITCEQLRAYIDHDSRIRRGITLTAEPAGYSAFAAVFNNPAGACNIKFSLIDSTTNEPLASGRPPLYRLFRIDTFNIRRMTPTTRGMRPSTAVKRPPVRPAIDGGITYSARQQAVISRLCLETIEQHYERRDATELHPRARTRAFPKRGFLPRRGFNSIPRNPPPMDETSSPSESIPPTPATTPVGPPMALDSPLPFDQWFEQINHSSNGLNPTLPVVESNDSDTLNSVDEPVLVDPIDL